MAFKDLFMFKGCFSAGLMQGIIPTVACATVIHLPIGLTLFIIYLCAEKALT